MDTTQQGETLRKLARLRRMENELITTVTKLRSDVETCILAGGCSDGAIGVDLCNLHFGYMTTYSEIENVLTAIRSDINETLDLVANDVK